MTFSIVMSHMVQKLTLRSRKVFHCLEIRFVRVFFRFLRGFLLVFVGGVRGKNESMTIPNPAHTQKMGKNILVKDIHLEHHLEILLIEEEALQLQRNMNVQK